jgi:hypothetical protein
MPALPPFDGGVAGGGGPGERVAVSDFPSPRDLSLSAMVGLPAVLAVKRSSAPPRLRLSFSVRSFNHPNRPTLCRAHEIFRDVMSEKASQAGEGMSSHNDGAALSFRRGSQDVRGDFLRIERFLELHQQAVDIDSSIREHLSQSPQDDFTLFDRFLFQAIVGLRAFGRHASFRRRFLGASPFEHSRRQLEMQQADAKSGGSADEVGDIADRSPRGRRPVCRDQDVLGAFHSLAPFLMT